MIQQFHLWVDTQKNENTCSNVFVHHVHGSIIHSRKMEATQVSKEMDEQNVLHR
jgi:hypothetical protein